MERRMVVLQVWHWTGKGEFVPLPLTSSVILLPSLFLCFASLFVKWKTCSSCGLLFVFQKGIIAYYIRLHIHGRALILVVPLSASILYLVNNNIIIPYVLDIKTAQPLKLVCMIVQVISSWLQWGEHLKEIAKYLFDHFNTLIWTLFMLILCLLSANILNTRTLKAFTCKNGTI